MARTTDFNETEALEAAMMLFWEVGYEATSIQGLEHVMGLKRTSIYNTFGNKRTLFQKSLMHYLNKVLMAQFVTAIEKAPTAKQAIEVLLREVIKFHFNKHNPGGCMVVLSVLESNQHDAETRKMLDLALKTLRSVIVSRLERGVKEGDLPKGTQCEVLGAQVATMMTGMIIMAKGNMPKKQLEGLVDYSISILFP